MKQLLRCTAFFLLININLSFGQDSLPIAQENTIWFMEYLDHSSGSSQLKKYINFTSGDTLVNHQLYHKLYFQSMESATSKLIAGIRHDENSQKTMAILLTDTEILGTWLHLTCSKTEEFELYDFSAKTGDVIGKDCNTGGGIVTDISQIDLFSINRKIDGSFSF